MTLHLDPANNDQQILGSALRCYLRHLRKEQRGAGYTELNAEIETVRNLIDRLSYAMEEQ